LQGLNQGLSGNLKLHGYSLFWLWFLITGMKLTG